MILLSHIRKKIQEGDRAKKGGRNFMNSFQFLEKKFTQNAKSQMMTMNLILVGWIVGEIK